MIYIHNVHINVFSKPEDDEEKIKATLIGLIPFDMGKEKITLDSQGATITEGRKIKILEIVLKKQRHVKGFIEFLALRLGKEQIEKIISQVESRVDDNANFFLRIDKDELMINNAYVLTDSGNCFHIRMSVASYPSNKDRAVEVVKSMLFNI